MIQTASTQPREFAPGSSGWCLADLDDPQVERLWDEGRLEMLEGVLVQMGAAYYNHLRVVHRLLRQLEDQLEQQGGDVSLEVDLVLDEQTVLKADAVLTLPEDRRRQRQARPASSEEDLGRLRVPPTIVIESVSRGHERHDYEVKRRRYAAFGVPNYWVVNHFDKSLLCLTLDQGQYREDARGQGEDELRPAALPGLVIRLKDVFRSPR